MSASLPLFPYLFGPLKAENSYSNIKMITPKITPGISRLHDHLLPLRRPTGESQLVTRAAPVRLSLTGDSHGRKAVRKILVNGPRGLARAHVRRPRLFAARHGERVRDWRVVDVAGCHWGRYGAFLRPCAAAICCQYLISIALGDVSTRRGPTWACSSPSNGWSNRTLRLEQIRPMQHPG